MNIHKLVEIRARSARTDTHLKYLSHLHKNIKIVDDDPEFKNCIHVSMDNMSDDDLEIILNTFAGQLEYSNKIAISMAKNKNQIFVEVN